MAEEITASSEIIERLTERLEALEKKVDEKDKKKKKKKRTGKKVTKSVSDMTEDFIRESGKITGSLIDATVEAMKEGADALSSLSEETDKENLGTISSAIVSVIRKTIEIQTKAVDKFEESYKEYDD